MSWGRRYAIGQEINLFLSYECGLCECEIHIDEVPLGEDYVEEIECSSCGATSRVEFKSTLFYSIATDLGADAEECVAPERTGGAS